MLLTRADILFQTKLGTDTRLLYTVPAGKTLYLTSIKCVNLDTTDAHTFNVFFVKPGFAPEIPYSDADTSLDAKQSVQVLDDPQECRLGPGAQVWGNCDEDDSVGITAMGGELV
jgi:hypothetical protein